MKEKQTKKELLKEIFRFLLIGGFATLVDYATFYLCNLVIFKSLDARWNLTLSTALGYTAGLLINWFFSARFIFNYKKKTTSKQFFLYLLICLIGLGITQLGMHLASPLFERTYWKIIVEFDFWKLFFKCLMTLLVLVFNYLGRKFIVFRDKDDENTNEIEEDVK